MRRADRLIKIVHYLRRMRQAVTARQIADHFEVCQRTVYRDIQDLMNSGVPIYGEAGVGYLIDKKYHLPPVMFDFDELEAIALGINMVRTWTDEKFSKIAESALEKIQAVLPESRLNDMQQLTTPLGREQRQDSLGGELFRYQGVHSYSTQDQIPLHRLERQNQQPNHQALVTGVLRTSVAGAVAGVKREKISGTFDWTAWLKLVIPGTTFKDEKDKTLKAYLAQCVT